MTTGLIVAAVVLLAATAFGLVRRRTDGRVRMFAIPGAAAGGSVSAGVPDVADTASGARPVPDGLGADSVDVTGGLTPDRIGSPLGSRATLLQFSSAFCAPCRTTRVVLADVASVADGVAHVEIDAESHLDLVRELGILRTPTTLILDGSGRIAGRAAGVPRKQQVIAAIGALDGSVI